VAIRHRGRGEGEEGGEMPLSAETSLANRAEKSARFLRLGSGAGEGNEGEGWGDWGEIDDCCSLIVDGRWEMEGGGDRGLEM